MLNSILILGSCYNKNKKISKFFTIIMLGNLIITQFSHVSLKFLIFNILIMGVLSSSIQKINNRKLNNLASIISIIIWSILIDVVSFYMFPLYSGVSLIHYIYMGIIFNLKYVLTNSYIVIGIELLSYLLKKIHNDKIILESKLSIN